MTNIFENLVNYDNSIYKERAYKIINRQINNDENVEVLTRYIYDLERRLSEINYMNFKGELLCQEKSYQSN